MALAGSKWLFVGIPCPGRMHCNNGGSCTFFPRLNIRACNCTGGYEGERCEYKSTLDVNPPASASGSSSAWISSEHHNAALLSLALDILTVALLTFIVLTIFCAWKNHRARQNGSGKPLNEEEGLLRLKERHNRKRATSFLAMLMGWDVTAEKKSSVRQSTAIQCEGVTGTSTDVPSHNPQVTGKLPQSKWHFIRHHFLRT